MNLSHTEYLPTLDQAHQTPVTPPLIVLHGLYGSKGNWHVLSKKLANRLATKVISKFNREVCFDGFRLTRCSLINVFNVYKIKALKLKTFKIKTRGWLTGW